ncbi:MAG: BMP family ABC transporter substrate-binding protein [Defluviitaleaceae bacterium]|nr:BMP family ABC transporter substrate-binding protein [Defluviitaleaceae bacterium]
MKRILKCVTLAAFALVFSFMFIACTNEETVPTVPVNIETGTAPATEQPATDTAANETTAAPETGFRIALVTDYGGVDDGSFNQGAWEGIVAFAESNAITHQFIQPLSESDAEYLNAIELAVNTGAEIIVAPGFLFTSAMYTAQDLFPNTNFLLLDTAPEVDGNVRIENNVAAVFYAEEQSGFLAGYAAVMEGYRNLGFMGGMPMPPVTRFGFGFLEGAEHAADVLGLAPGEVTVNFTYVMTFAPSPEIAAQAGAWFASGTEVIFAAAGGAGFSVFNAAEAANASTIGVDIDQSAVSPTVITSALKEISTSVYQVLVQHFNGNFPGGEYVIFDAATYGVSLAMNTSRFQNFTMEQYIDVFTRLVEGEVVPTTDTTISPSQLNLNLVVVNEM